MKNIKLLSALSLMMLITSATSGVVSADPLTDRSTAGSIEFDNDTATIVTPTDPENPGSVLPVIPTDPSYPGEVITGPSGGLFLAIVPKNFNFGSHKIGAADIFSGGILTFDQEASFDDRAYSQAVEVHDGRIDKHDWTLSAQLSAFDSGKLAGSTITIDNAKTVSQFPNQDLLLIQGAQTEITQTSSVDFLKSNPKAKGDTSAVWSDASDVKIHVPADKITKGVHNATVDWTLIAGAN
ncbi:MAG: WxL domain-containing protein [Pseudolactococcus laudensis]